MIGFISFWVGVLIKIFTVWFIAIGLFALRRPKRFAQRAPAARFAVVVAARNEAGVIGSLVESLIKQDYPDELYDVFVVPNNCSDDTAGAARRAGATVLTCPRPVGCKGDVLRDTLSWLMWEKPQYGAYIVFDADNIALPGYLSAMNDALLAGARVVKGRLKAANPYSSWVAGCYAIYFETFHLLYNRARMSCGLSAKLVGTGFCVSRDVLIKTHGWNTTTMAEDAEFAAILAGLGERVYYQPEAVSLDEQPLGFSLSLTQRRRWCSGIMQAGRLALPSLVKALSLKNPYALDSVMFFLSPMAQLLAPVPILLGGLSFALAPTAIIPAALGLLRLIALSWLTASATAAAVLIPSGMWDRRMLKGVLTYPIFMASWIPLQFAAFFAPARVWRPIAHSAPPPLPESAVSGR
ncbi:MAG: glycosyltransferase [Oscillospiraceae bacterium]|nr:glycosyltransferase [Oscillospiraceae bacterium]